MALVATIPKSHGGSAEASVVAVSRPTTSPAPESRSPFALIASTCGLRDVVGPDLDVVELGKVRREERPDGAATDDADPHDAAVLQVPTVTRG